MRPPRPYRPATSTPLATPPLRDCPHNPASLVAPHACLQYEMVARQNAEAYHRLQASRAAMPGMHAVGAAAGLAAGPAGLRGEKGPLGWTEPSLPIAGRPGPPAASDKALPCVLCSARLLRPNRPMAAPPAALPAPWALPHHVDAGAVSLPITRTPLHHCSVRRSLPMATRTPA